VFPWHVTVFYASKLESHIIIMSLNHLAGGLVQCCHLVCRCWLIKPGFGSLFDWRPKLVI